ncbi:hypothetical protein SDC9_192672 [bioreactor metagenome]|uniref:Uncharacterized protein n=1 Tax=bioreactor metagenome TaxID=1076179 RepID=A0A645I1F1_9ZZZZ
MFQKQGIVIIGSFALIDRRVFIECGFQNMKVNKKFPHFTLTQNIIGTITTSKEMKQNTNEKQIRKYLFKHSPAFVFLTSSNPDVHSGLCGKRSK